MSATRSPYLIACLTSVACARVTAPIESQANDVDQSRATTVDAPIEAAGPGIEPPAAAADARITPGGSSLHAFATIKNSGDAFPPDPHICPLRGVTWLCALGGILAVSEHGIVPARVFEAGLPADGEVDDIVGSWPEDAWLALSQGDLPPRRRSVYRWHGGHWTLSQAGFPTFGQPSIAPWGAGGALAAERQRMRPDANVPESDRFRGLGARAASPPRLLPLTNCKRPPRIGPVKPFANGSLIADLDCPDGVASFIERWSSTSASPKAETLPIDTDAGAKSLDIQGIDADGPDDVTVFGNEYYGGHSTSGDNPSRAYLAHFDGNTWSKETAPPGTQTLGGYIRNAGGNSWAISDPIDRPQVWSMARNRPWMVVSIPAIADVTTLCEPSTISKAEDGTVWVWCRVRQNRDGYGHGPTAALLSTLAPSRVVDLKSL